MENTHPIAHASMYQDGIRPLIQTLPSELLLIIFKFVYVAARGKKFGLDIPCPNEICAIEQKCFCDVKSDGEYDWNNDGKRLPLALFPNSVASVCSRWGKLMLLVPTFWTRIIIILDADIFSPLDFEHQLDCSGDRPIDVIVTRTSFSDAVGLKDIENSRMVRVIAALRAHFHRCRVLRIEVVHSSSLPRCLAVLPPVMPHIEDLSLNSCINSGPPEVQPYRMLDRASPFICDLEKFTIDGWNFAELHDRLLIADGSRFSSCNSLSIKFGGENFSSDYIVKFFEESLVDQLEVDSVIFRQGNNKIDSSNPCDLTLKNLDAVATYMMLYICDSIDLLAIDNCQLTGSLSTEADTLHLENMGPNQGLGDFLRMWRGTELQVTRCPGFDDNALNMLGRVDKGDYKRSKSDRMQELFIGGCHNFSVDALKELVKKRSNPLSTCLTLEKLCVEYSGSLLEEDFTWFEQNIPTFSWNV